MNEIPDERRGMMLYGNAGADSLVGSKFADVLDAGADNDVLIGNNGNVLLSNTSLTGAGTQSHTNMERFVITGGSGDDRLDASACTRGAVTLLGLAGNDTLVGSSSGGDNNDRIDGHGGHDTWLGGTGIPVVQKSTTFMKQHANHNEKSPPEKPKGVPLGYRRRLTGRCCTCGRCNTGARRNRRV